MNILFVSAYDAPRGQSARTYLLAKGLVELGHDVSFMTNGFNHFSRKETLNKGEFYRIEVIDGIRTIWLKTIPYKTNGLDRVLNMFSNAIMCLLIQFKLKVKPDIIVGPSVPPFTAMAAYLISKRTGAKFVFEIRDPWPEILILMGNLTQGGVLSRIFRLISSFLYRKSNCIITTLNKIDPILERASVSPKKVAYLLNPVVLPRTVTGLRESIYTERFTVTYVGGFGFGQDIDTMLEVTKLLRSENIFFKFVGVPKASIESYRKGFGTEKVEFLPVVEKSEVPAILERSSVLISAHRDDGAFKYGINSNKLHDYLAVGRPVVFSANAPGNPVELSGGGFCVPPERPDSMADAILELSNLPVEELEKMGEKGLEYARENLDIDKLSRKMELIFNTILEKGNYYAR